MDQRLDLLQLVDDRLSQTLALSLTWTYHIEYDDLVLALLEPATRHIECLLRTNLPDSTHGVTIDIYQALAPSLEVEECIAWLLQIECGTIDSRDTLTLLIDKRLDRLEIHILVEVVGIFDVEHLPTTLQIYANLGVATVERVAELNIRHNTLEIFDRTTEIDTSHSLDQDVDLRALLASRECDFALAVAAVELTDVCAVDEYLSIVVCLQTQFSASRDRRQGSAIEY